jgi:hypothetical protein
MCGDTSEYERRFDRMGLSCLIHLMSSRSCQLRLKKILKKTHSIRFAQVHTANVKQLNRREDWIWLLAEQFVHLCQC